jgi:hypothetical protein
MSVTLPFGDIEFFDNQIPGVTAGNYWITVGQALTDVGSGGRIDDGDLAAHQEFVVGAPQFTLPDGDVVSMHPPANSTGQFGEQLAHVVLREPALPWERAMTDRAHTEPWLALIVLTPDEFIGGSGTTFTNTATVADFLSAADTTVYVPSVTREDDVAPDSPLTFIRLSTDVFARVMPRLNEARYLAHCRQGNIGDKAAQQLDPDGFFSVVAANRFPAAPAAGSTTAVTNIAHLVSLEGLDAVLADPPAFGTRTSVAVVSLASWAFHCSGDSTADFAGLARALAAPPADALLLRLAPSALPSTDAGNAAIARLAAGFVPLPYHMRSGEDTFAWYRGPLAPELPAPLVKGTPFFTADSAMAYDAAHGVFDASYVAAWEAGRAAALADRAFGARLFALRQRSHALTDLLLQRLQSAYHLDQTDIASLEHDATVQDALLSVLHADLIASIGTPAAVTANAQRAVAPAAPADPVAAVRAFFADPAVQDKVAALVADDVLLVAQWLGRLLLLYPLPFDVLVPDPRMLPVESIRFFYLDSNWTGALLDGALSIGLESSRQTFYHETMQGMLQRAAWDAAAVYRASLTGSEPPPPQANPAPITGVLLRSALVSGWPTLAVRPYLQDGVTLLKILRMDHVSPSVLLCLFAGVPEQLELSEPQEGFRLGVDDDGNAVLRNLVAPAGAGDPAIGQQTKTPLVPMYDATGKQQWLMRAGGSRVINLAPDDPNGAVQRLHTALGSSAGDLNAFGPAAFALQMVKSPEAIRFPTGAAG